MSWTNECTESNQFKVKKVEEVKQVLKNMGFNTYIEDNSISFSTSGEGIFFDESTEIVISSKPIKIDELSEPTNIVGIISDSCIDNIDLDDIGYGLTVDDVKTQPIVEFLQNQLLNEKEYIAITCAGFESRCSGSYNPFGDVMVITKNNVNYASLYSALEDMLIKNNI